MPNGQKKSAKEYIGAIVVIIIAVLFYFATCGDSGSSSSRSSSSKKNGFVGSDGKYHAYVPEFGNDVNSWMEENW